MTEGARIQPFFGGGASYLITKESQKIEDSSKSIGSTTSINFPIPRAFVSFDWNFSQNKRLGTMLDFYFNYSAWKPAGEYEETFPETTMFTINWGISLLFKYLFG